jgi:glutathione synthase/RimK-type ligase-like ATP-grasp enzyme
MQSVVVIERPKHWPLGDLPGVTVVTARDYLLDPRFSELKRTKVYNLCRTYGYQTTGYYVSLLAAARGHRPMPSVSTIQDLRLSPLARIVSEDLDELIQSSLARLESKEFSLSIYFGRNLAKRYDRLSTALFNLFPAPLLRADFAFHKRWRLESLHAIATNEIPEGHKPFVVDRARKYFERPHSGGGLRHYRYDLAILANPEESHPPSDEKALGRFIRAARELKIQASLIDKTDYGRIAEFDALFIRETTSVNHHTYRFARRAAAEGMIVIDDPESIVRCTNKVYLAELFLRNDVRCPKTMIVHRDNIRDVGDRLGFPAVVKQPDSSFSRGVVKAANAEELQQHLASFLEKSELAVVQEYVPSTFDWRIGVLDRRALYACKYYMAPGDWRIATMSTAGEQSYGRSETIPIAHVPTKALKMAERAAGLIGTGLYGVDLKEVDGRFMVIEVNDNPSIDSDVEDLVLKDDLYAAVMRCFLERLDARTQNGA